MPRHRRPGRPRKYYSKKKKSSHQSLWEKAFVPDIKPETLREITGVVLIAFSVLLFLSIIGIGGSFGESIFKLIKISIGWTTYMFPLVTLLLGIALFYPEIFPISSNTTLGIILYFSSFSGIIHLFIEDPLEAAQTGYGGGFVGYGVTNLFLLKFLSPAACFVLLFAIFLISVLLATNVSLRRFFEFVKGLISRPTREKISINQPVVNFKNKEIQTRVKESKEDFEVLTVGSDTKWTPPPLDLLGSTTTQADSGNIKANVSVIQKTLSNFGVSVTMADVNVGPTVTQYTLKPHEGVKLNKITTLDRDLALALASHPIRIEAPIPGKSLVGVEVPNKKAALVRLRPVVESQVFKSNPSKLKVALGLDVAGNPQIADIAKMPHLLIAGATGSGKSVCINSLLLSLIYQNSPSELKLILVDPKRVELTHYNGVPYLLSPVVVDPEKTVSALKWVVKEMDRRYHLFQEAKKRNIAEYNQAMGKEGLPYLVLVIDELADLMAVAAREVEASICRLAQMARATGIHLIVATQRPSVDIITGLIKANITTRIAFSVASQVDSRTILDQNGAEKLLGMGDMLYISAEISKPKRIQGVYISEKEIKNVTSYLKEEGAPEYNEEVLTQPVRTGGELFEAPEDDLFLDACNVVVQSKKASASLLQRRLRVGYARAARLLDLLEERGVIGPADGSRPRDVLVDDVSQVVREE